MTAPKAKWDRSGPQRPPLPSKFAHLDAPPLQNKAPLSKPGTPLLTRPAGVTKPTATHKAGALKHGIAAAITGHGNLGALSTASKSSGGGINQLSKNPPDTLPWPAKVDPIGWIRILCPEVFDTHDLFHAVIHSKRRTPLVALVNDSFDHPVLTAAGKLIPPEKPQEKSAQQDFFYGSPDHDGDAISIVCLNGTIRVSRIFLHETSKVLRKLHAAAEMLPTIITCRKVELDLLGLFLRYAATGECSGFGDLLGVACVCDNLGAFDMLKPLLERLASILRGRAMNLAAVIYVYKRTDHREDRKADDPNDLRMFMLRAMHMVLVMHQRSSSAYPRVLRNVGASEALAVEIVKDLAKVVKRYGKPTIKHPAESFEYELQEKPRQCSPENPEVQQQLDDLALLGSID